MKYLLQNSIALLSIGLLLGSTAATAQLTPAPPALLNTNATTDTGNDVDPVITTDGLGNWVAVWRSNENLAGAGTDTDIFVATSTDNGGSWSGPAPLNTNATTDTGADFNPTITTDGLGNWVAVWRSNENLAGAGTDEDIFVATFTFGAVPSLPASSWIGLIVLTLILSAAGVFAFRRKTARQQ